MEWMDTGQAAAYLGCSADHVSALAHRGDLPGEMVSRSRPGRGNQWRFRPADVEAYRLSGKPKPPDDSRYVCLRDAARIIQRSNSATKAYCIEGVLPLIDVEAVPWNERVPYQKSYTERAEAEALGMRLQERGLWRHSRQSLTWEIKASTEDIIWFAGFFDGEGTIHVANRARECRSAWSLRIAINGTAMKTICGFPALFGGRAYEAPYRRSLNHAPQATWRAGSRQAAIILRLLLPYLRLKHRQAALAIQFQERVDQSRHNSYHPVPPEEIEWRAAIAKQISDLNHDYL